MWISMLATEALSTDVETGKQKKKKKREKNDCSQNQNTRK